MKKSIIVFFALLFILEAVQAQNLKPGFEKAEYAPLLKISAQFGDSSYAERLSLSKGYQMLYLSPVMGMDNRWALWQNTEGIPVITIRGTTRKEISWLANFYSAMVPAKGKLQLSQTKTFTYQLAENPRASVHTGWLISTGFLAEDIISKIDSCYKTGNRSFYITGHSQG